MPEDDEGARTGAEVEEDEDEDEEGEGDEGEAEDEDDDGGETDGRAPGGGHGPTWGTPCAALYG